ncbi:putative enoyl-CoA hydratase [Pigmentiphaga humi]|uniref:Putative enoyl-CoA hydratase n=1 Tax=Pigmentiphaga humi TaxID=2478468 RepID=A0A3P4AVJ7_9BURK|nr:enoyl-CoA hydratase/isomerase family protein [Pigmentiphaga humi]VCU68074.1 putative enoyl-CoA hydratase [Pigmentiphaga humi]
MQSPFVHFIVSGDVAILGIDHPPVNALGAAQRAALDQALSRAEQDRGIAAVVIAGCGRMFSGGGDIREIGRPDAPGTVGMAALARRVETFSKPVVAALHGRCIGGGVLLSMACHARVGAGDSVLMLPELNLGLVPGAGGTQRLPRLVGLENALDMVIRAQAWDAPTARERGLLDEIAASGEGEDAPAMLAASPVAAACRRARAIAAGVLPWRRTAQLAVAPARDGLREQYCRVAAACFPERQAGGEAVDLILAAARLAFEDGMQAERECFARLAGGSQAQSLIHLFFAERALAKADDAPGPDARRAIAARFLQAADDTRPPFARWVGIARSCLAEGLATRAEFIDAIAVKDCGFPALHGGPLHYAGQH